MLDREFASRRVLNATDLGKMSNTRERLRALEEAAVGGDQWAIEFDGKRQEGSVVECEVELFADTAGALQKRRGGWSDDKRKRFEDSWGTLLTSRNYSRHRPF